MGNNALYNLLDYGKESIKNLLEKKYLHVILYQLLTSLKSTRRIDTILIINATESTNNREIEIDELSRERDIFSNDVNRIRKHENNIKLILKDTRSNRNRAGHGLEDKVNLLLHKFDIKRKEFFGSILNGVNCRRLMKYHVDIINDINEIFIEMSKG